MTLATFQKTLKSLWMTPEGKAALSSSDALELYLNACGLSPAEQRSLLSQPQERLQQYDYMLLANLRDTLEAIFPQTRALLGETWHDTVQGYFWAHPASTYRLVATAQAFSQYLSENTAEKTDLPFLPELALYEWAEAELLNAENPVYPANLAPRVPVIADELTALGPVLNEVSMLMHFHYPISAILEQLQQDGSVKLWPEPAPTSVWIYRNMKPHVCRYFQLNPLLAAWLGLVQEAQMQKTTISYRDSITPLFEALSQSSPKLTQAQIEREFLGILGQLLEKGILLGSVPVIPGS